MNNSVRLAQSLVLCLALIQLTACGSLDITPAASSDNSTSNNTTETPQPKTISDITWEMQDSPLRASGVVTAVHPQMGVLAFGGSLFPSSDGDLLWSRPQNQAWASASLARGRSYARGYVLGDEFYVMGGLNNSVAQSEFFKVDLNTNSSTTLNAMLEARASFATGTFSNGDVIVVGGYQPSALGFVNRHTVKSSAEMFHATSGQWTSYPAHPAGPTTHCAGFVWNDYFYTVGGYYPTGDGGLERDYHRTIWRTRHDSLSWGAQATMPDALGGHAVVVNGDEAIFLGGHTQEQIYNDRVFVMNLKNNDIKQLTTNMPMAPNDITASIIDGKIYIVGGALNTGSNDNQSDKLLVGTIVLK